MSEHPGPIYEFALFIDADSVTECDVWLDDHVREVLRVPGVTDCYVSSISSTQSGRVARVCHHVMASDEVLDTYLETFSAQLENDLKDRFADKVDFSDRVLREDETHDIPSGETPNCLNCGAHLRGQYCGQCGQRSRSRLIKLRELVADAFGDLFELDSRLWQTLVPLVIRPGQLTYDYLQGRRARFMPPFRMYLVLSLIFFVVAFFNPREELSLFFEPPDSGELAADEGEEEGSIIVAFNDNEGEEIEDDCELEDEDVRGVSGWFLKGLTPERFREVCEKIVADKGKSLLDKVTDNVPAALIVLLPLMALVLKILYPLSRRYYVEHLLFFVHLHAFLFLLITLQILFVRLTAMFALPELVTVLVVLSSSIYALVYLFVAMRRVYGQGKIVTFLKYIVLIFAYITGFSTIIALTFAMAAFSV